MFTVSGAPQAVLATGVDDGGPRGRQLRRDVLRCPLRLETDATLLTHPMIRSCRLSRSSPTTPARNNPIFRKETEGPRSHVSSHVHQGLIGIVATRLSWPLLCVHRQLLPRATLAATNYEQDSSRHPPIRPRRHTRCVVVPPGFSRPQRVVTKRPVREERVTAVEFDVPGPTRSVVVVRGDRFACALVTNRPVFELRATERPLPITPILPAGLDRQLSPTPNPGVIWNSNGFNTSGQG